MSKKLDEKLNLISRDMKDRKITQTELLDIKIICDEINWIRLIAN